VSGFLGSNEPGCLPPGEQGEIISQVFSGMIAGMPLQRVGEIEGEIA